MAQRWASFPMALARAAGREFSADRAGRMAAALAYFGALSLAPLLLIAVAVAGGLFGREAAEGLIVGELERTVGAELASTVQDLIIGARRSGAAVGAVGGVLLFLSASSLFLQVEAILRDVFGAPAEEGRAAMRVLRHRLFAFVAAVSVGLVLAALLAANAAISFLDEVLPDPLQWLGPLLGVLGPLLSLLLLMVVFGLLFRFESGVRLPGRAIRRGAALTGLLFVVGAIALGLYFSTIEVGSATGVAASAVVLLFFVYYQAQVFLFGAEVTKVYAQRLDPSLVAPAAPPMSMLEAKPKPRSDVLLAFLAGLLLGFRRRKE